MADAPESRCRISVLRGSAYEERDDVSALPALLAAPDATLWIDLAQAGRDDIVAVTRALALHPLVTEDILEGNQRSKIEVTDEHIHLVLFALEHGTELVAHEVDVVVGRTFLLTVHDVAWDPRRSNHLREGVAPVLAHGPDHLLWALVDDLVDGYFPVIDRIGDVIDELQDAVVRHATPATLERLFGLKRELLTVRRAVAPVREIFNQLTNRDLALIDTEEIVYFRDVYDHLIRLADEVDNQRELVSGTLDVYLSTVNNNLSVIMKRLTGITLILAGIGAVGGLFGMSEATAAFRGQEGLGFWAVIGLTVAAASMLAVWLRRIDWI